VIGSATNDNRFLLVTQLPLTAARLGALTNFLILSHKSRHNSSFQ
jgi:hypothetical protein